MSTTAPEAPLRRTLRLAGPARARLAVAAALGAAAAATGIGLLATSGWLISRASQQPGIAGLGLAIVAVRFFAISRGLFRYGERLTGHDAAFRLLADLRVSVYRRLERLAPTGLPAFRRGDLLTRLVSDIDTLQDLPLRVLPPWVIAVVVGGATLAVVWLLLPAAAIVLGVCLLAAATVVPWLTQAIARRTERREAAARGDLGTSLVDLLEGAADLVAYGAAPAQLQRVGDADRELTRIAASAANTTGVGAALVQLLTGLAVWGAVVVGVPAVAHGRLDGVFLAVVVLTPLAAFELVGGLPAAAQTMERVRRSAARLFEVLDAPVPVVEPDAPEPLPAGPHHLVLSGVRARYGNGPLVLDGVDLDLRPGRRVAVIGPSGAGKSTLAAVVLRFVPYEGSAHLDGVELAALDGDDVRRVVGLVEQDAHLFDTTIAENLRLARRDATDDDLRSVLERVHLGPWLATLPAGIATDVGERGTAVSGGQRQRLAVARALLADPPVLMLDEPTEHLDPPTADALMADLLALTRGRTTVLVTHRLRGLEDVDEIVVLVDGRVEARGTHDELLAGGGRYGELWRAEEAQPAGFSPVATGGASVALGPRTRARNV